LLHSIAEIELLKRLKKRKKLRQAQLSKSAEARAQPKEQVPPRVPAQQPAKPMSLSERYARLGVPFDLSARNTTRL